MATPIKQDGEGRGRELCTPTHPPCQVSDATVVHVGEVGKGCGLLSVIQQYGIKTGHCVHHPVREAGAREIMNTIYSICNRVHFHTILLYCLSL